MLDVIRISAPCKLNLHLKVLERRTDGYHDIESVFQRISLCDELTVAVVPEREAFQLESPFMTLPPVNTISRAVELFRSRTGITAGLSIRLEKRIPAGAGLGGGSSDAAATLVSLDRLFGTALDLPALTEMAFEIGSDVPFFLSAPAAVVSGRGERLQSIEARSDLYGVLVWPDVHSSTAEAYRLVDEYQAGGLQNRKTWPPLAELEEMYRLPAAEWGFANSFTAPLTAKYPVIGEVLRYFRNNGCCFAEMTGSGSAVFALFDSSVSADRVYTDLAKRWSDCHKFVLLAS